MDAVELAFAGIARQAGAKEVLSFDMGGTTAKSCLIQNGVAGLVPRFHLARLERAHPAENTRPGAP